MNQLYLVGAAVFILVVLVCCVFYYFMRRSSDTGIITQEETTQPIILPSGLDPTVAAFLSSLNIGSMTQQTLSQARDIVKGYTTSPNFKIPTTQSLYNASISMTTNGTTYDLIKYTLTPKGIQRTSTIIVYVSGNKWILGGVPNFRFASQLVSQTGCVVEMIQYSQSPDSKYPKQASEVYQFIRTIKSTYSDSKIVVLMDDTACSFIVYIVEMIMEGMFTIDMLVLINPVLWNDFDSASYLQYGTIPWVSRADMMWYWSQYISSDWNMDKDALKNKLKPGSDIKFPPTTIILAENDVVRSEGENFVISLKNMGTNVYSSVIPGTIHDFMVIDALQNSPPTTNTLALIVGQINQLSKTGTPF